MGKWKYESWGKASLNAHSAAREAVNPFIKAISRAVGQTVATAHMADHSLGGALYALKALKLAGKKVDEERAWQNERLQQLPAEIVELIQVTSKKKEIGLKI